MNLEIWYSSSDLKDLWRLFCFICRKSFTKENLWSCYCKHWWWHHSHWRKGLWLWAPVNFIQIVLPKWRLSMDHPATDPKVCKTFYGCYSNSRWFFWLQLGRFWNITNLRNNRKIMSFWIHACCCFYLIIIIQWYISNGSFFVLKK